ncbi:hypothetical protein FISHEDRAFT_63368 [Fistulina hepatica ATCC 64428]|uniref:F-box domain-containing protein n=1 Tax=Fistulina hepatica ATCC 64428 TaxID=1128425 RepID=A0A0D7ANL5_9AGAR|nr:hypothetical protein FISHEDRAFT_63368 [Fistulina hepatica ATCC 64428]
MPASRESRDNAFEESEELRLFREAWKAEVRDRHEQTTQFRSDHHDDSIVGRPEAAISSSSAAGHAVPPLTTKAALAVYHRAVQHEQRSEIDQALQCYNTDVAQDHALDAVEKVAQDLKSSLTLHDIESPTTATLGEILSNLPQDLKFEREIEEEGLPIATLPDELLLHILALLDTTSIERFALVCRKALVLSLDSGIWRHFVTRAYVPPQVPHKDIVIKLLGGFRFDYRRFFIEQPRVRLDGVYIAVCYYVRPGLSENPWVNTNHFITYYRYLRFLPGGEVLSLLTNEENEPASIVPILKPNLRMKGLLRGSWRLNSTTIELTDLVDVSALTTQSNVRYVFNMVLKLHSRPVLGRWNKLDIATYQTVNLETQCESPVALKNERPLWFSKVRSYTSI